MKKLLVAIVAAYIVLMLTNYLVHQIWLMSDYAAIPASHRSPAGIMHRFWAMAVGQFIFAALFAYISGAVWRKSRGSFRAFVTASSSRCLR